MAGRQVGKERGEMAGRQAGGTQCSNSKMFVIQNKAI